MNTRDLDVGGMMLHKCIFSTYFLRTWIGCISIGNTAVEVSVFIKGGKSYLIAV